MTAFGRYISREAQLFSSNKKRIHPKLVFRRTDFADYIDGKFRDTFLDPLSSFWIDPGRTSDIHGALVIGEQDHRSFEIAGLGNHLSNVIANPWHLHTTEEARGHVKESL